MIPPGSIVLTKKERLTVIRLIGLLQTHLELAIVVTWKEDVKYAQNYFRDRKAAERMVKKLEAGMPNG